MRVTIYTDAAFHIRHRIGAWAAWCQAGRTHVQRADLCSREISIPQHAELQAGVEGVRFAKRLWPGMTDALLLTDCEGILVHLDRRPTGNRDPVTLGFRRQLDELGVEVEARWTPGHQPPDSGAPARLNDAVDKLAGRVLRAEVERRAAGLPVRRRKGDPPIVDPPELVELRRRTREALALRYGVDVYGLQQARAWAAYLLDLKRVKVSKLEAHHCEAVLSVLAAGA